jgi:hypothetical protein
LTSVAFQCWLAGRSPKISGSSSGANYAVRQVLKLEPEPVCF